MAPRHHLNGLRVQQYGDTSVYLVDQGLRRLIPTQVKRWITTAEAMDRFQFDRARIKRWDVPLAGLGLPDRPDISWP